MTAYYDQPLRKLLGTLSPTINWLTAEGCVDVSRVPAEHLDAIKQLERIGVVHKRNNRLYELQKVRLKKLMDSMGMEKLVPLAAAAATIETPVASLEKATAPADPTAIN
jgi:predicted transcriptional regulator